MSRVNTPKRTRREQAAATRERMIRAAIEVFTEEGYVGARMSDIAARAGVAVQTVYFTFHTKGELLQACFDHAVLGPDRLPPEEQTFYAELLAARSGRAALNRFVAGNTAILVRSAAIKEVAESAGHEPDATEVVDRSETPAQGGARQDRGPAGRPVRATRRPGRRDRHGSAVDAVLVLDVPHPAALRMERRGVLGLADGHPGAAAPRPAGAALGGAVLEHWAIVAPRETHHPMLLRGASEVVIDVLVLARDVGEPADLRGEWIRGARHRCGPVVSSRPGGPHLDGAAAQERRPGGSARTYVREDREDGAGWRWEADPPSPVSGDHRRVGLPLNTRSRSTRTPVSDARKLCQVLPSSVTAVGKANTHGSSRPRAATGSGG